MQPRPTAETRKPSRPSARVGVLERLELVIVQLTLLLALPRIPPTFTPSLMSRVVHFEIHASNPEGLIPFYKSMFGWSIEPWGPPGMYWLIRTAPDTDTGMEPPGIDGGMVPRRGGMASEGQAVNAFVCTVNVEDVSAAMEKAVALGGTVALPRMPIPTVGWLGYFKDPDGNIVGVMQNDPTAK